MTGQISRTSNPFSKRLSKHSVFILQGYHHCYAVLHSQPVPGLPRNVSLHLLDGTVYDHWRETRCHHSCTAVACERQTGQMRLMRTMREKLPHEPARERAIGTGRDNASRMHSVRRLL